MHASSAIGITIAAAIAFAASGAGAQPQRARTGSAPEPAAVADTATTIVFNRPIIVFRAPLGASSPRERADAAQRRVMAAIAAGARDSVTTRRVPEGVLVAIGDRPVFSVTPGDVDSLAGEAVADAAAAAGRRLADAIAADSESRNLWRTLRAVLLAAVATVLFGAGLRLLRRVRTASTPQVDRLARRASPHLGIGKLELLDAPRLATILRRVVDLAITAGALVATYLWLTFVLTQFPYTRPWGDRLGQYLLAMLHGFGVQVAGALPGLLAVVLIFFVTRFATRLVTLFFEAVETQRIEVPWTHPDTARPSRRILVALAWLFAIVVAYPYIPGSGSDVFKGVSVFAGLVISLGSSGVVNQAMSGLVLMYSRAFRPGDFLQIGETEGEVVDLGMLTTKVRTYRGELVTIPNAMAVTTRTVNYSRLADAGCSILSTVVTIGYDAPWRQVHALLLEAARRTRGLQREPEPYVLQRSLSDFYVEYELNVRLAAESNRAWVRSALHANIQDCFNEHGVQIMSPHFEGQPASPVVVPRARWNEPPAAPEPAGPGSSG